MASQRTFMDQLATQMGIKSPADWYSVSVRDVQKYQQGRSLLASQYGGSLIKALECIYPEHKWNWKNNKRAKTQLFLFNMASQLFAKLGYEVKMNYRIRYIFPDTTARHYDVSYV
jgi:hypothetical protein